MILHGDCLEKLKTLEANSIDSVVTDPPYGLSFMGKKWDYDVPSVDVWREVFRVLKPGGHVLAFGGTRTYHRLVVNIEDAGFEIRDQIQWIYGSGFPKSLDVSKAIDKAAGAEREVIGSNPNNRPAKTKNGAGFDADKWGRGISGEPAVMPITAPATAEAKQWQGWGTALKPANEPICLARKPIEGTVAANVLKHGTGALNIDASRVGVAENDPNHRKPSVPFTGRVFDVADGGSNGRPTENLNALGRWPANVLLDEAAAQVLDAQTGELGSGGSKRNSKKSELHGWTGTDNDRIQDSGGASRFFKVIPSTEHANESACKTTSALNAENISETSQAIEQTVKTLFAQRSATPFLDLANHYLNAKDAEKKSKNTETDFARSLAKALAKIESQSNRCLAFIVSRSELIPSLSHALSVALLESTGTTPTIQNQQKLNGFVSLAIASIITSERSVQSFELDQARFAYIPKASKRERNAGLEGMPAKKSGVKNDSGRGFSEADPYKEVLNQNFHPTVKPIKLMQYLVRMVTPPGGVVLDPFMGSGSTGVAAKALGFKFVGCELSKEYFEIAKKRIEAAS